jgi:hypothetical protein
LQHLLAAGDPAPQLGSEHPPVGLREKHSGPALQNWLVDTLRACDFGNQVFASKPAQIIVACREVYRDIIEE